MAILQEKARMILLANGTVLDGTGGPARQASVLVDGGKIKEVGPIAAGPDMEVIDCSGLVISPGFVDVHSHSDLEALQHRSEKVRQGVTSEVVGNCGFSLFPTLSLEGLAPTFNIFAGRGENEWADADAYFAAIDTECSYTNVAALTGHSTLRATVARMQSGKLSDAARQQAETILARCMEQGSIGLSTGLNEVPSAYGDIDELVGLCGVVKRYGGFYTSHLRDYKFKVIEAVEEAIEIGRQSGVPVQLSHLQAVGRKNWNKMDAVLDLVDQAVAEGVDVGIDAYPYLAGSCNITQMLPTWAQEGGSEALLARLADADTRSRIVDETLENMANTWDDILIATVPITKEVCDKTVQAVADERGTSGVETVMDLLLENNGIVTIISFNQSEENLRKVLSHPCTSIITDGLVTEGKPHPRTFSTYPKFFGEFIRGKQWIPLETAMYKATGMPAQRFGLTGRGTVAPGQWADLVVFAAEQIGTQATYEEPDLPVEGIHYVLVNGQWAVRGDVVQAGYTGRALRHSG
jgi:dihydroorotase/N-acyl-D-amino-acid deacylase